MERKEHWTRKVKREMEELKQELEEYRRALLQARADFENYKRRTARHFEEVGEFAKSELLKKMLPIVDDFERALSFENNPYAEGMQMIYRQLVDFLKKEGVEKMETVGKEFDPNLHEAVGWVESEDKDGIIVEEVQAGYTYKGKLLRPARVKVARKGGNNG
ncbi:nucleotide exchange factor GrpE [bacterium]|nr:nucleotide exchange factor GrpE [bacterium]